MKKTMVILISLFLTATFLLIGDIAKAEGKQEKVKKYYVVFQEKNTPNKAKKVLQGSDSNISINKFYKKLNTAVMKLNEKQLNKLKKNKHVLFVVEEKKINIYSENTTENNTDLEEYHIDKLKVKEMWQSGLKGNGVKVAIIDSGFPEHEDIPYTSGTSFVSYYNNEDQRIFAPFEYTHDLYDGHGTMVSSLIGGKHNSKGASGISPEVSMYGVKVFDVDTPIEGDPCSPYVAKGTLYDIADALEWTIQNEMDIISMSLSFGYEVKQAEDVNEEHYIQPEIKDLIDYWLKQVRDSGITTFSSAGNQSGSDTIGCSPFEDDIKRPVKYPASSPYVIGVGSIGSNDEISEFSNVGENLSFVSYGENIVVNNLNNSYGDTANGTSFSTPIVAGIASLYKQQYPNATPKQIEGILIEKSVDLEPLGKDDTF